MAGRGSVQVRDHDGAAFGLQEGDGLGFGGVAHGDAGERAHAGLHGFRIAEVDGSGGVQNVGDAEPVGHAQEGSGITRILHAVEHEHAAVGARVEVVPRKHGERIGRSVKRRYFAQVASRYFEAVGPQ